MASGPLTGGENEATEEELSAHRGGGGHPSSLPTLGPYRLPLWGGWRRIKRIQRDEELGFVIAHGRVKAGSQGTTEHNHLLEGEKVRP